MPLIFGWLLNGFYVALLGCVAPVLAYRRIRLGKYKGGWREKLTGVLHRKTPERRCVWFHAVSVGEVLQLQKVLEETAIRFRDAELLITTTTDTGYNLARDKYAKYTVAYFPLDFTWAVARALDAIRPDLVVLVELELWPNFIFACRRRSIPLALINGRISEKSFRGYCQIKPLIRRVLGCFDVLAVQNETYAERLKELGAPTERAIVTGNIKFDRVESDPANSKTNELRHSFGIAPGERVFIAGSTQAPEEMYALDAWQNLRSTFPNVRLILVPRHKERFDEVAELVHQRGLPLLRRSQTNSSATGADHSVPPVTHLVGPIGATSPDRETSPEVLLLDTLGELAACWGLADIAFVGGSLDNNRGGQNMIEPAGYGAAILFGPNTWNFKDVTEALISRNASRVVRTADELTQALRELLQSPERVAEMGQNAKAFVASQQGATARTVDEMMKLVDQRSGGRKEGDGRTREAER